jgi:flagellar hook-length control protein FliK
MQIFPLDLTSAQTIAAAAVETAQADSFPQIFSSFIEEGRSQYCGLPEGFSALTPTGGTLDRDAADLFKKALRERGAAREALESLEALNASDSPLTVGRVFAVLSGQSRASAALEGDDRLNFTQLLGKLGFSKDESEEILGLTDEGGTTAAWKRVAARLKDLGGEQTEAHLTEISALLAGLEMPEETRRQILAAFEKTDSLSLTGQELEALLAPAAQKAAARESARESVQALMREAMTQALEEGRRKERTDPVADTRGSRRSEQARALMLNSVREKVGAPLESAGSGQNAGGTFTAAGLEQNSGESSAAAGSRRNSGESFTRSGRDEADARPGENLRTDSLPAPDKGAEKTSGAEKSADSALNRLLQRIDAAAAPGNQNTETSRQAPAQDVNSAARNFRQEIFSQVENGFLQNAGDGSRQLTLQLNPQDLGQITLILSVNQGEVKALIRAENGETAAVLTEQMAELKASLEAQGLKVKELDVQTQMQGNAFTGQWTGAGEHNLMRDARERARMIRLSLLRRETGDALRTAPGPQAKEETGLHVVA